MGVAVSGPMQGKKLVKLPSTMTTWGKWKALHTDTTVYVKRSIPYNQRFSGATVARSAGSSNGPIEANDLVVGLEGHVESKVYPLRRLAARRAVNDTLDGAPVLVYLSEDKTTARVFERRVETRTLNFAPADGDRVRDADRKSVV